MIIKKEQGNTIEKTGYVCKDHPWILLDHRVFDESDHLLQAELLVYDTNGSIVEDPKLAYDVWQYEWSNIDFKKLVIDYPQLTEIVSNFETK